jgi:hypothetical protein
MEPWALRAVPAQIAVWWEDRVEMRLKEGATEAEIAAERRFAQMVGVVRLQTARALAAEMTTIAAYLINSTIQPVPRVLPKQFPSGVGQYVSYPLQPDVPVQMHVVTHLPDGLHGTLSTAIQDLSLVQARLVLNWFNDQYNADRNFYIGTEIKAVRTTLWIANSRRILELDPFNGTVIDSEGWVDRRGAYTFPANYRVPPLGPPIG